MKLPSISKKSCACAKAKEDKTADKSTFRIPNSQGFTLIELMMVVLVILMLSGMLFKLSSIIKDRSERAKATADIENIQHALNEYFAEYGIYPPVTTTAFKYEDTSLQPPSMQDPGFTNGVGYAYGLVSHLYKRSDLAKNVNENRPDWNPDTDRDETAKARWAQYLSDISLSTGISPKEIGSGEGVQSYSNKVTTIKDPWGSEYKYESRPPYQSYKVWSTHLE